MLLCVGGVHMGYSCGSVIHETRMAFEAPVPHSMQESLQRLGLEYVDMYLIHSPNDRRHRLEQWQALEKAKGMGLARSIGVSNYGVHHLQVFDGCALCSGDVARPPWLSVGPNRSLKGTVCVAGGRAGGGLERGPRPRQ